MGQTKNIFKNIICNCLTHNKASSDKVTECLLGRVGISIPDIVYTDSVIAWAKARERLTLISRS